jgi:hypothetical protein
MTTRGFPYSRTVKCPTQYLIERYVRRTANAWHSMAIECLARDSLYFLEYLALHICEANAKQGRLSLARIAQAEHFCSLTF